MLLGGSALTHGLAAQATPRGMRVHSGYGMSDTCPLLCLTHLSEVELEQPVVGVPDPQWGERPVALVVSEGITAEMLVAHLHQYVESGRINKWAIPRQIRLVADIPKTSVGKINKRLIREQELSQ